MRKIVVNESIYGIPLIVIIGSWQEFCDFCYDEYKLEHDAEVDFVAYAQFAVNKMKRITLIWLPYLSQGSVVDMVSLTHELGHIVLFIMDDKQIRTIPHEYNHQNLYLFGYFLYEVLTENRKQLKELREAKK